VGKPKKKTKGPGPLVTNRQARRDYHIIDTLEAGVSLVGTEVKSLRAGQCSLAEAFIDIRNEEAYLINAHIAEYGHSSNVYNHEPKRPRRLLLHKAEIQRVMGKALQKGYTLIPLAIHLRGRWLKVEIVRTSRSGT
jgi:SsrA-binding protein